MAAACVDMMIDGRFLLVWAVYTSVLRGCEMNGCAIELKIYSSRSLGRRESVYINLRRYNPQAARALNYPTS